jgi:hypothetical protein
MAEQPPTTAQIAIKTAIVVLIVCVVLNAAFYPLSDLYFDSHKNLGPADIRWAFAQFTFAVGLAAFAVSLAPRTIGHVAAALLGLANVIAALVSFGAGLTPVLGFALLIGGGAMVALAYFSYFKKSRAAWAFLAALAGVFGTCLLFGAPKVRSLVGIGLWTALIFPGLQFVTMSALMMIRGDYRQS